MKYTTQAKVRFGDVDPAGIVFYPRYFEMLNAAVEDWFEQALGFSFAHLHLSAGLGVPTVKLSCDFAAPSLLGEVLDVELRVIELGRSSCALNYRISGEGGDRLEGQLVIVCMDLKARKAVAWPSQIRERIDGGVAA